MSLRATTATRSTPCCRCRPRRSTSCWRSPKTTATATRSSRTSARRTGGELRLSAGTLYRSIQRMLEQGLIVEPRERPAPELDDERRRYYRITPFGTAVARAEAAAPERSSCGWRARCGFAPGTGLMRLYRALLHLCRPSFRAEYGGGDGARSSRGGGATRAGPPARRSLWAASAARRRARNAARVHLDILRQDLRYTARTPAPRRPASRSPSSSWPRSASARRPRRSRSPTTC